MDYNYTSRSSGDDVFVIFFYLCCCILLLPFFAFWIWMLIDVAKRKFPEGKENERTIWLLIILLTSPITTFVGVGSIIYYFLVKRKYDSAPVQSVPTVAQVIDTKPIEEVEKQVVNDAVAEAKLEDQITQEKKSEE